MNCKQCGAIMPPQAIICPYCGCDSRTPSVQTLNNSPRYQQPVQAQYVQPQPQPVYVTPQQQAEASSILVFGILGLAFACTFWLSFLGIIFSAIDRSKVNNYLYRYGFLSGKSKVGNILSRIGLPVAIVLTAFAVVYGIILLAAVAGN